jgi:FkbM family methyltransferase
VSGIEDAWKTVRDHAMLGLTFWKKTASIKGVKLSLRGASPRVRFALMTDYEMEDARLCTKVLDKNDRVLELGSAIGFVALFCMKTIGIKHLAMVEANPHLFETIEDNFALNALRATDLLNLAAGPSDGDVSFNVSRDYFACTLLDHSVATEAVTVKQRTIPSIIAQLSFTPNVLIMDIEGGETQIPIEHLYLFDKIIVEFHARFVGQPAIDRIVAGLEAGGFVRAGQDNWSSAFVRKAAHVRDVSLERAVG